MDQNSFETQFQQWQAMPGAGDNSYFHWKDIGAHPVDLRFAALVQLYLQSDSEQRQLDRDHFKGQDDRLWEMIFYVRRVAKLIESQDDVKWLRLGLAAAAIQDGRVDFRDLSVSLVVLRYGAQRGGIDPYPFIDEAIEIAGPSSHNPSSWSGYDIFRNIITTRERTRPSDATFIIQRFGPEDWAAECSATGDKKSKPGLLERIKKVIFGFNKGDNGF
jgi:hypothetical protein